MPLHQLATLLYDILPELDHLSETLPKGDKLGEGGRAGHLDVIALGTQWLKATIHVQVDDPVLELRAHYRFSLLRRCLVWRRINCVTIGDRASCAVSVHGCLLRIAQVLFKAKDFLEGASSSV